MKLPVLAALAVLSLSAAPAGAATIHVETTTQVGMGIFGTYAPQFTTGEAVRIRYSYDDSAPDVNPAIGAGTFHGSVISLSVEFLDGGPSFVFGGPITSIVASDNNNFGDSFAVGATGFVSGSLLGGETPINLTVSFATVVIPGPPVLVVDERPSPPPFSYLSGQLSLATSSGSVAMSLVGGNGVAGVGVPEPGLAVLLGGALAGAAAVGRRRS